MAKPGVTFEEVAEAAQQIEAEGKSATIRAVREKLGDKGSPNTIHKHLTQWRGEVPAEKASTHQVPELIAQAWAKEIKAVEDKARAEVLDVARRATEEATELAKAGEALEAERDELASIVDELKTARDVASGKAESYAQEIERMRAELAACAEARSQAEQKAAGLTERLGIATAYIDELRSQAESKKKPAPAKKKPAQGQLPTI